MAKVHVKVDDLVYVRCGKDKASTGKVLRVIPSENRVVVEGVNIVSKHQKAQGMNKQAGIVQFEAPISASNVMLVCPSCNRPTKVAHVVDENGRKIRKCKACGAEISEIKAAKKA